MMPTSSNQSFQMLAERTSFCTIRGRQHHYTIALFDKYLIELTTRQQKIILHGLKMTPLKLRGRHGQNRFIISLVPSNMQADRHAQQFDSKDEMQHNAESEAKQIS
jgi:hypothetical protein